MASPDNMQGAITRSDLATLPRILSDNGYETHAIGKMHFIPPRRNNGLDRLELMEEVPAFREQDDYARYLKEVGLGDVQHIHGVRHLLYMLPQRSLIPEEHQGTKWVADRGIEFLHANRGSHPFFLWLSWIAPSILPLTCRSATPTYTKTPICRNQSSRPRRRLRWLKRASRWAIYPRPTTFVACVRSTTPRAAFVDEQVGRVLEALDETGLAEKTLVLFPQRPW